MSADLNLSMFRAYDIRTPARDLSLANAERLARAEARYFRDTLKTTTVVLARDARSTGPQYLEVGIRVFRDLGFTVYANPQVSSTCQFYYSCMRHPQAAGIMYGASHNPGTDTGQKIVGPGVAPIARGIGPAGGQDAIKQLYIDDAGLNPTGVRGKLHMYNYMDDYLDFSMKQAGVKPGDLAGASILIDFLCGAAGQEMLIALDRAGADLTPRNLVPDGAFPAGAPNPVVPEAVAPSMAALKAGTYDFAMFFDGDGDRLDFYANDARQLSPAFNMSAIGPRLMALYPQVKNPRVYADLKANPLALIRIAKLGLGVEVMRNGHSQIKESLKNNWASGVIAAVEESSHYYINWAIGGDIFSTENTCFYALLTANAWYHNKALYAELLEQQGATYRAREWGYKFPTDALRAAALSEVENHFTSHGAGAMNRTADGMDMEATLIRDGLPFVIDGSTKLGGDWTQVAQRVSQSENGLARWEVTANTLARKDDAVAAIERIVAKHGAGEKYVG